MEKIAYIPFKDIKSIEIYINTITQAPITNSPRYKANQKKTKIGYMQHTGRHTQATRRRNQYD